MIKDAPRNSQQHTVYKTADGTRVPGVTTILGILNKPALVPWANSLGLQGIKVGEYVDDKAAIGTLAHQMIADHLRGVKTDTSDYSQRQIYQAENSVLSYLEWEKGHTIKPILIEEPLVSEDFRYGGTIDCYADLDGKMTLLDLKTSKAVYPEMFYQLAAYWDLLCENGYQIQSSMILRIGRDSTEGFEVKIRDNLSKELDIFDHCLSIYQTQRR